MTDFRCSVFGLGAVFLLLWRPLSVDLRMRAFAWRSSHYVSACMRVLAPPPLAGKKKGFFLYRRNQQPPSCRGLEIRISIRRYFFIWKRRFRGDVRRQISTRWIATKLILAKNPGFQRHFVGHEPPNTPLLPSSSPPPPPLLSRYYLWFPPSVRVSFKPREGEPSDDRQHRRDVRRKIISDIMMHLCIFKGGSGVLFFARFFFDVREKVLMRMHI